MRLASRLEVLPVTFAVPAVEYAGHHLHRRDACLGWEMCGPKVRGRAGRLQAGTGGSPITPSVAMPRRTPRPGAVIAHTPQAGDSVRRAAQDENTVHSTPRHDTAVVCEARPRAADPDTPRPRTCIDCVACYRTAAP